MCATRAASFCWVSPVISTSTTDDRGPVDGYEPGAPAREVAATALRRSGGLRRGRVRRRTQNHREDIDNFRGPQPGIAPDSIQLSASISLACRHEMLAGYGCSLRHSMAQAATVGAYYSAKDRHTPCFVRSRTSDEERDRRYRRDASSPANIFHRRSSMKTMRAELTTIGIAGAMALSLGAACGGASPDDPNALHGTDVAELSGTSCEAGVNDDDAYCWINAYLGFGSFEGCDAGYSYAIARCAEGWIPVFRLYSGTLHFESSNYADGGNREDVFMFAAHPQPDANGEPIYRCFIRGAPGDFPSRSGNCEGQGTPASFHGYSYGPNVGASAVYRCRTGGGGHTDHFLSRDPACEGTVNEGLLGYAF